MVAQCDDGKRRLVKGSRNGNNDDNNYKGEIMCIYIGVMRWGVREMDN